MVYHHTFQFKLNEQRQPVLATEETIYQARRHDGVYDIYVVNGLEYQRERVAALIEKGEWIVV